MIWLAALMPLALPLLLGPERGLLAAILTASLCGFLLVLNGVL